MNNNNKSKRHSKQLSHSLHNLVQLRFQSGYLFSLYVYTVFFKKKEKENGKMPEKESYQIKLNNNVEFLSTKIFSARNQM